MKKAQSMTEYAILLAVVLAAVIAVQTYLKRSLEGRFKSSADSISESQFGANYEENSWSQQTSHDITGTSTDFWSKTELKDEANFGGKYTKQIGLANYQGGQVSFSNYEINYNVKGGGNDLFSE